MPEHEKPLSDREQEVLEEIERRLHEEDPRLARAAAGTTLYTYTARRLRLGAIAFLAGFVMLMLFPISIWVAVTGFGVMLASGLLVYQQLKRLGQEQLRELRRRGRFSATGMLARMAQRFRGNNRGSG